MSGHFWFPAEAPTRAARYRPSWALEGRSLPDALPRFASMSGTVNCSRPVSPSIRHAERLSLNVWPCTGATSTNIATRSPLSATRLTGPLPRSCVNSGLVVGIVGRNENPGALPQELHGGGHQPLLLRALVVSQPLQPGPLERQRPGRLVLENLDDVNAVGLLLGLADPAGAELQGLGKQCIAQVNFGGEVKLVAVVARLRQTIAGNHFLHRSVGPQGVHGIMSLLSVLLGRTIARGDN